MSKKVVFTADSLDNAHKFKQVLSAIGVSVEAASSRQFKEAIARNDDCDLVICETGPVPKDVISDVASMLSGRKASVLFIIPQDKLSGIQLPERPKCDFVVSNATPEECDTRIRMLLWPASNGSQEIIVIDNMTVNLATYQVKVSNEPLDLTYLEYALLTFLVTHPGRTYSRDTLLSRVWGLDYYGGSRTVDVHVRRVRAKLGPELAQRLETIRGVGYLWNS